MAMSTGSMGLSKQVLRLPPHLRQHFLPQFQPTPVSLTTRSPYVALPTEIQAIPSGFTLYPHYFTVDEQSRLLEAGLRALDVIGGVVKFEGDNGKRGKHQVQQDRVEKGLQGAFLPPESYKFQRGAENGIIKQYRQRLVTELPESGNTERSFAETPNQLLQRLMSFYHPSSQSRIMTHLVHLGPKGWVAPHRESRREVGETIVGVSLGGERVLRIEKRHPEEGDQPIDVLLPSGSVYVQRDDVRNQWTSSILLPGDETGDPLPGIGQRLSILLREDIADVERKHLNIVAKEASARLSSKLAGQHIGILDPDTFDRQAVAYAAALDHDGVPVHFAPLTAEEEVLTAGAEDARELAMDLRSMGKPADILSGMSPLEKRKAARSAKGKTDEQLIKQNMQKRKWGKW